MRVWTPRPLYFLILVFFLRLPSVTAGEGGQKRETEAPYSSGTQIQEGIALESTADPLYQKCDFDCLYEKAQDPISMQLLYVKKKQDFLIEYGLKKRIHGGMADPQDETDARAVLGSYCPKGDSEGGDTEECIRRYQEIMNMWVLKARTALGKNQAAVMKLKCAHYDAQGNCTDSKTPVVETQGNSSDKNKFDQGSWVTKSKNLADQLSKQKDAIAHLSKVTEPTWDTLNHDFEPKEEDFILFKKVPDPTDPTKTVEVPDLKADGSTQIDKAAFKRAEDAWKGDNSDPTSGILGNLKAIQQDAKESHLSIKDAISNDQKNFLKEFKGAPGKGDDRSMRRKLYDDARSEYVHQVNKDLDNLNKTGGKTNQMSFTPNSRPSSKPSNIPGYGYDPKTGDQTGDETIIARPAQENKTDSRFTHATASQIVFESSPDRQVASPPASSAPIPPTVLPGKAPASGPKVPPAEVDPGSLFVLPF